jgi:hypothetical protein
VEYRVFPDDRHLPFLYGASIAKTTREEQIMLFNYLGAEQVARDRDEELIREAAVGRMVREARPSSPRAIRLKRLARVAAPAFAALIVLLLGFLG